MVWGAIGRDFKGPLIFVPEDVRSNAYIYQHLLGDFEKWIEQPNRIGRNPDGSWRRPFTFQQDGAPAHTANSTQQWLKQHFPDFIKKDEWPPSSPDINPIELIWGILKTRVNVEAHDSLESLEDALATEWNALTIEEINAVTDGWMDRIDAMIDAGGERFE